MEKTQKHDVYFKRCNSWLILCFALFSHSQSIAANQSLASIEQQVRHFIISEYKQDKPKINIQSIDSRLKLGKCGQKLSIKWHHPVKTGRNLIKVQCHAKTQWKLFVPVTLEIFKQVYVATAAIRKGETINRLNTKKKLLDIGKLHRGYIENITPYDEKKTRRNIRQGEVLNSHLFEIRHAIKRGQAIILETGNKAISVKVKGTALSNGQKGDLIKVRNNSSSIIVEAIVQDKGKALVIY